MDDSLRASSLVDWMRGGDPALAWQVERDLMGAPESVWQATRARVATEGYGARMLEHQDADGQWAGGAYFPAGFEWNSPEAAEGQPWTATTWSLNALREWGLDASVLAGTAEKLEANSRWEYDDLPYWGGEVDACINGLTLANGAWLGGDVSGIADWFVEHQMAEGGWNCEWVEGSTRSSVHSTLNSLKGILSYELATGGTPTLTDARHRGEEYLLERALLRRKSTGEYIVGSARLFAYPHRHVYSALHAVDYFRAAAVHDRTAPDPRLAEAVEVIRAARNDDGTWTQEYRHPGRVWFEVDVPVGEPSPWLTFQSARALSWWDAAREDRA